MPLVHTDVNFVSNDYFPSRWFCCPIEHTVCGTWTWVHCAGAQIFSFLMWANAVEIFVMAACRRVSSTTPICIDGGRLENMPGQPTCLHSLPLKSSSRDDAPFNFIRSSTCSFRGVSATLQGWQGGMLHVRRVTLKTRLPLCPSLVSLFTSRLYPWLRPWRAMLRTKTPGAQDRDTPRRGFQRESRGLWSIVESQASACLKAQQ